MRLLPERVVGLDDVRAGGDVVAVHGGDQLGLAEHELVVAARVQDAALVQERAHRAVEQQRAGGEGASAGKRLHGRRGRTRPAGRARACRGCAGPFAARRRARPARGVRRRTTRCRRPSAPRAPRPCSGGVMRSPRPRRRTGDRARSSARAWSARVRAEGVARAASSVIPALRRAPASAEVRLRRGATSRRAIDTRRDHRDREVDLRRPTPAATRCSRRGNSSPSRRPRSRRARHDRVPSARVDRRCSVAEALHRWCAWPVGRRKYALDLEARVPMETASWSRPRRGRGAASTRRDERARGDPVRAAIDRCPACRVVEGDGARWSPARRRRRCRRARRSRRARRAGQLVHRAPRQVDDLGAGRPSPCARGCASGAGGSPRKNQLGRPSIAGVYAAAS